VPGGVPGVDRPSPPPEFPPPQETNSNARTLITILAAARRLLANIRVAAAAGPRPIIQNVEKGDSRKEDRLERESAATDGAVVVTVTFTVTAEDASSATEDSESVHVAFDGAPVQVNCTVPANPLPEVSVRR
jgi:hypothetical protein